MPTFAWEGRTRSGEVRKGNMEATSEADVEARLKQLNFASSRIKRAAFHINWAQLFAGKVKSNEIVIFTRQLATMIDAGLPIVQCLEILATQAESKPLRRILQDVKSQVEQGASFSEALKRHPRVFNELFANLIAAGEAGGILDVILQRLATYIEKSKKLASQVRGAMIYPAAILGLAFVIVVFLLWKVIPVFENMFKQFGGGSLPAPTQFVIDLSRWFSGNIIYLFAGGAILFFGGGYVLRQPKGRRVFDTVALRMPIFGSLLRKVAVARFCRTLGTLLGAGVPILDALTIVAKTAGNVVVTDAIMHARQKISEGKSMAEPLAATKVFPGMVVQMIAVGEQTGAMDAMLQKIADFYDEEVDVAVGALTKLLEPIMMVFLGGIVGGLLIAMYLPIFEMAGQVKGG